MPARSWPRLNMISVDNICHGGVALLAAIRGRQPLPRPAPPTSPPGPASSAPTTPSDDSTWMVAAPAAGGVLLVCMLASLGVLLLKRRQEKLAALPGLQEPLVVSTVEGDDDLNAELISAEAALSTSGAFGS